VVETRKATKHVVLNLSNPNTSAGIKNLQNNFRGKGKVFLRRERKGEVMEGKEKRWGTVRGGRKARGAECRLTQFEK